MRCSGPNRRTFKTPFEKSKNPILYEICTNPMTTDFIEAAATILEDEPSTEFVLIATPPLANLSWEPGEKFRIIMRSSLSAATIGSFIDNLRELADELEEELDDQ